MRPQIVSVIVACLLLAVSSEAEQPRTVDIGFSRVSFRESDLRDLYGSLPAFRLQVMRFGLGYDWLGLGLGLAIAFDHQDSGRLAFVSDSRSSLIFAPIYVQALARHALADWFAVAAGPRLGLALYRESWQANAAAWDVTADRHKSGASYSLGAVSRVRFQFSEIGALLAEYEWIAARFERHADPGNEFQEETLRGGWHSISLGWELPWQW